MRQSKLVSILILIGLIGSGCNTIAVQSSQTPTEIPPTITATLTPTIIPSPTGTFTPSSTAIAGGNGNLLLNCTDAEGDREQNKIFTYDIGSGSIKPHTPNLSNTENLFQLEEVLAASPSGRVVLWRKCDFTPTKNTCDIYISDGTIATNKSFNFLYNNLYKLHFVSDDYIIYAYPSNASDVLNGQPFLGARFFLQNIRNNEKINLGSREDGQLGDFYLSPTGRYIANYYFIGDLYYIDIIDLEEQRILDLNLQGFWVEWVATEKFLYRAPILLGGDLVYTPHIVDVGTGEINKLENIWLRPSPDGSLVVYTNRINRNFQIFLQNTTDETKTPITETREFTDIPLRWSPNGKQIIYFFYTETTTQIRIYDIDTKVTALILEFNDTRKDGKYASELDGNLYLPLGFTTEDVYTSWSPDGKWFIMGFQNYTERRAINHYFDYFLCNFNGCRLIKPPDTTYCSKAIWTNE